MTNSRTFLYRVHGVALGGVITYPFHEVIESQASVALPAAGGHAQSCVENFSYRNLISFRKAHTQVTGGLDPVTGAHKSVVTVRIEGLNIENMFTAESITCRIASKHTLVDPDNSEQKKLGLKADESEIVALGSEFVGVRIGGAEAKITLDHGLFSEFPNYRKLCKDYEVHSDVRDAFRPYLFRDLKGDVPQPLQARYKWAREKFAKKLPENGPVLCSLVSSIDSDHLKDRIFGNAIVLPNFGTLYLADFYIEEHWRRLEMFRVEFASPPGGGGSGGGGGGGGGYPPNNG